MTSYLQQKLQSFQIISSSTSTQEDAARKHEDDGLAHEKTKEIERSKIGIMRALIQAQYPSAKDVDDLMIRRFLRACDLDVKKASAMFLKYLSWRKEFVPNGFITPSEIHNDLPTISCSCKDMIRLDVQLRLFCCPPQAHLCGRV